MKKAVKWGIAAVVIVAVVGGGYVMAARSKAEAKAAPKFRTATVDHGAITQVVLASGTMQPVTTVSVGTQVSGTVSERLVDFNDHVKAGQILVKLTPALFQARERQAHAQLESAKASLVLARATQERNERLQKQGFISSLALDQSRSQLDAALAGLDLARAQVDSAQTDLNNSIVRSPIDGVVIKRNIDIGQTVAASFQTPELFQIAQDLKKMQIYTSVSEADVGLIKPGQVVRFVVDAYQDREFEGRVDQFRLSPNSTSSVVTYNVVIGVDNPDELLKPGMTAQTRIVVAAKQDVTRVPTAALRFVPDDTQTQKDKDKTKADPTKAATQAAAPADPNDDGVLTNFGNGKKVYRIYTVNADNEPVRHDVTIGISNTRFTELTSGDIKPGDEVVTRLINVTPTSSN